MFTKKGTVWVLLMREALSRRRYVFCVRHRRFNINLKAPGNSFWYELKQMKNRKTNKLL